MNVIPFDLEHAGEDMARRGLVLKYIPSAMELHINVRYSKLNGREKLESHLQQCHVTGDPIITLDDSYPFHDTILLCLWSSLEGYRFNCTSRNIIRWLHFTVNEAFNEIDRLL
jgi:hypothetical protein